MAKKHIHVHYHDANPDGTISPDEDRREADLGRKVISAVAEFKREAYDIGGSFRGPGIWSRIKRLLTRDAKNHLGETEYETYKKWKEACRRANPSVRFEGDEDICQAKPGVGEWDGVVGVVYKQKTGDDGGFSPEIKQRLAEINQDLTAAARKLDSLTSAMSGRNTQLSELDRKIADARNYCYQIR